MRKPFVSVITVVRDIAGDVDRLLDTLTAVLQPACDDYELIVVDNGSTDSTVGELEAAVQRLPNIQTYCLVSSCDLDPAFLAGLEQAIGDHVVLFDPTTDDPATIPALIETAQTGVDIALAVPKGGHHKGGPAYRLLSGAFVRGFRAMSGIDLRTDASRFRIMSRRVVNYVLRHDAAFMAHQAIPLFGGFKAVAIEAGGNALLSGRVKPNVTAGFRRAAGIVTTTSTAPLRIATLACLLAAGASLAYSVYVVATYLLLGDGVAPGWTTLSLQVSGLFFLLSLAVGMLSEYVLSMAALSSRKPPYYVAREFRSPLISREARLNVVRMSGNDAA